MLNEKSQNKLESTKELIVYIQEYSPFYQSIISKVYY